MPIVSPFTGAGPKPKKVECIAAQICINSKHKLSAGTGATGALRATEAVRGDRHVMTFFAAARLDGLLRRTEQVQTT